MTAQFIPITEVDRMPRFSNRDAKPEGPQGKPKFRLEHVSGLEYDPASSLYLIKGLLPAHGLATVYGPPKNYKSFVIMDAAFAVARGTEWAGRRVRQGAVIYLAAEGAMGARMRACAYRMRHGLEEPDFPFYFVDARPNLGAEKSDKAELITVIEAECQAREIRVSMIVIDTLARALCGADENGEGMIHFVNNAEDIAGHFQCLTVAVHHTPHSGDRMRGHSSLLGSVVASWAVVKAENLRAQITLEHAKDLETGLAWSAVMSAQPIGSDADGDEVSSLVVEHIEPPEHDGLAEKGRAGKGFISIPPAAKAFMNLFEQALGDHGQSVRPFTNGPAVRAIELEKLRAAFYASRPDSSDDSRRKAFNRAKDGLIDRTILKAEKIPGVGVMLWRL